MASLDQDLRDEFNRIGQVKSLSQGQALEMWKTWGIREADRGGICWELCRRWIKLQLKPVQTNVYDDEVAQDDVYSLFPTNRAEILELIQEHAAHNQAGVDTNYQIGGTKVLSKAKRKWGGIFRLKAKGLKSRSAVIDHMYGENGLYIFGYYKNGGHAVAFHITAEKISFFDPNLGEFTTRNGNEQTRAAFKSWFGQYWGRYYKDEYTRGQRELTRYGADPVGV